MGFKLKVLALAVAAVTSLSASAVNYMGAQTNLTKGQQISSKNGLYFLIMQNDGNLVLYFRNTDGRTYPTGFSSGTGGEWASMQNDGNLAVYKANGTWKWQAGTGGRTISMGYKLTLGNDGSLDIRDPNNNVIKNLYTDRCNGSHPAAIAGYPGYRPTYTVPSSIPGGETYGTVYASCGVQAKTNAMQQGYSLNSYMDKTPYAF